MESSITTFDILNDTDSLLTIVREPECFEFDLPPNETVTIEVRSCKNSILLRHSLDNGKISISVIDDNSLYRVKHKGVDVFDKYMD